VVRRLKRPSWLGHDVPLPAVPKAPEEEEDVNAPEEAEPDIFAMYNHLQVDTSCISAHVYTYCTTHRFIYALIIQSMGYTYHIFYSTTSLLETRVCVSEEPGSVRYFVPIRLYKKSGEFVFLSVVEKLGLLTRAALQTATRASKRAEKIDGAFNSIESCQVEKRVYRQGLYMSACATF
jgi:hypothetical protein